MAGIEELARDRLGFERLRPGQERAVQALADGRDSTTFVFLSPE
ncbi:MAG: hypothetical protein ACRDPY_13695 [Streptosporangiaceae bacterium]